MAMIILIDSMLLSRGRCIHAAIAEVYRLEDIHGQNTLVETWVLQTAESCMSITTSQHAELGPWSFKMNSALQDFYRLPQDLPETGEVSKPVSFQVVLNDRGMGPSLCIYVKRERWADVKL